jgi:excisionase family DNA binding protein
MTLRHGDDDALTREEAAQLLGVSSRTIDRYAHKGLLVRYLTAGGLPRFHRDEVDRLRLLRPAVRDEARTAP